MSENVSIPRPNSGQRYEIFGGAALFAEDRPPTRFQTLLTQAGTLSLPSIADEFQTRWAFFLSTHFNPDPKYCLSGSQGNEVARIIFETLDALPDDQAAVLIRLVSDYSQDRTKTPVAYFTWINLLDYLLDRRRITTMRSHVTISP